MHLSEVSAYIYIMIYYFSATVHIFFCLNDPPGPYDSLEESMVGLNSVYMGRSKLNNKNSVEL